MSSLNFNNFNFNKGFIGMLIILTILLLAIMMSSCNSTQVYQRGQSELKFAKQPDNGITFNHPRVKHK